MAIRNGCSACEYVGRCPANARVEKTCPACTAVALVAGFSRSEECRPVLFAAVRINDRDVLHHWVRHRHCWSLRLCSNRLLLDCQSTDEFPAIDHFFVAELIDARIVGIEHALIFIAHGKLTCKNHTLQHNRSASGRAAPGRLRVSHSSTLDRVRVCIPHDCISADSGFCKCGAQFMRALRNHGYSDSEPKSIIAAAVSEALVNLGSSLFLAWRFGAIGVAIGTGIGSLVSVSVHFAISMRLTRPVISVSRRRLFLRGILRPSIICLPSALLLLRWWPATYLRLVSSMSMLWVLCTVTPAYFCLNREERQNFSRLILPSMRRILARFVPVAFET